MRQLLIILLLTAAIDAGAQNFPLQQMIAGKKAEGVSFEQITAFRLQGEKSLNGKDKYQLLRIDAGFSKRLLSLKPAALQLMIPVSGTQTIVCDLIRINLGHVMFTQNNKSPVEDIVMPVSYQGVVAGEKKRNSVVLVVNENYLSVLVSLPNQAIQVTKANETDPFAYRLYNSQQMTFPSMITDCGTAATLKSAKPLDDIDLTGNLLDSILYKFKCVSVFIDCLDSLYIARGSSMQSTTDFVVELFSEAAAGYANENIMIEMSNVNVWTTPDPFAHDTRSNAVKSIVQYYQDNFYGNVGVGLDFSKGPPRAGIASYIGISKSYLPNDCKVYHDTTGEFAYDDLNYFVSVENFPVGPNTTGPQIYSFMHELGHLLGAHHTKWCGWQLTASPLTFGALDSCGPVEGSCMKGPPPPITGATIMSYCVTGENPNNFVNYNNGFGLLPGNAIKNFIGQNNCISKCVDCILFNDRGIPGSPVALTTVVPAVSFLKRKR